MAATTSQLPYDRPTDPAKRHATPSPTARTGPARGRCSRRSASPTRTSPSRSSASRRRGSRRCPATSTSGGWRSRQGGHPGGGRHADGVQHDRGQRRRDDGHRGHEGLAGQPRGHRRLDRARRARPPVRRRRLPRRLRQDRSRGGDGARPPRRPGPRPLQRHDLPGHLQGQARRRRSSPSSRRSAPTGRARSRSTSCTRSRTPRAPAPGACGGQFTANTMAWSSSSSGLSPAGLNGIPAEDPAKDDAARARRRARHGPRPPRHPARRHRHPRARSRTRSRRSPRPAARPTASCTCWRSPTSSASRSTSTSSARSPTGRRSSPTCRPGGRYTASDMYDAGGVALVMRELLKRPACSTATSRRSTAGRSREIAADAVETPGPEGRPSRSTTPIKPTGGLAILHGSLAPDGCVVKLAGHERRQHRGPARVFDSEAACYEAVRDRRIERRRRRRHPLRGPGRRARACRRC